MKKVSIIIPVYNVEAFLPRCLDSMVAQTLQDIECLIINDGSPDKSQDIIDRYVEKYPDLFRCIMKENGGLSDARNLGMHHASATYIGFIDSDDYIEPTMYEQLYKKAIADDADIVVCDFSMDWESSNFSQRISGLKNNEADLKRQLLISPGSAWNKLYKKSLFMDYDIKYPIGLWYEDLATTGKLILHSQRVSYVQKPLLHYIQREGSIMSSMSPKIFDIYTALESIETYYRNQNQFDDYEMEIEYMYVENLALYGTLRFLKLPQPSQQIEVKKLLTYMKQKFPNWISNPYIKTLSKKDQFTLYLFYYNLVPVLKTLVKMSQSLKK